MTIYEFVGLCCEPSFQVYEIYDIDSGKTLYKGTGDEIPTDLEDYEVSSYDCISLANNKDVITLNICYYNG